MKSSARPAFLRPPLAAAVVAFAAPCLAQISIVSDNFSNVTVNGTGAAQTATSSGYTYGQQISTNIYAGTTSNGGVLSFVSVNNAIGFIQFAPVTLSQVGDYISLSYKLTYPNGANDVNSALRYGLYNTLGNLNTAKFYNATTNPVGDSAKGYYVTTNPGGVGAAWTAGGMSPNEDLGNQMATAGNSILGGAAGSTAALASFPRTTVFGVTTQTVSLMITKTAAGVTVSGSVAGDVFSRADNASPFTTFDTFFFGNGATAGAWTMDDLSITTNAIPEPGTAGILAGFAALVACVARRRAGSRR